MPTTERSSPTATSAVNEKRRPPLTTFATRLISTTRSWRSSPCGLTVLYSRSRLMKQSRVEKPSTSKLETAFARTVGERCNAAVVAVAAAVKDARLDARVRSALGEKLAGFLRLFRAVELSQLVLGPRDGGQRRSGVVVDELRGHAAIRAKDRDA